MCSEKTVPCTICDIFVMGERNVNLIAHDYLTPSKTIETLHASSNDYEDRVYYVYNYEGTHFRLFLSVLELISFFESDVEPKNSFDSEEELNNFINQL